MDLNKLRAFLCVARHRNFTKASEELFISQPALSKKISDFEREIGAPLMKRDNRTVELTPAGMLLYAEAPTILSVVDDLTKRVQEVSRRQHQQISIVCSGVESDILAPLLHGFRRTHPDVAVMLRWASAPVVKQLIVTNMVDLGFQISIDVLQEKNVRYLPVIQDCLNIVVGKYHHLASEKHLHLDDLIKERYIAIKSTDKHLPYEYIMNYFRDQDVTFQGGLSVVDSLDTLVLYVSTGMGISSLSSRAKSRYGDILRFIPVDCPILVETDLVWNQNNTNPAKDIFLDFVRTALPVPLTPDSEPLELD